MSLRKAVGGCSPQRLLYGVPAILRLQSAVVPRYGGDKVFPWEYPVPRILYKYFPPNLFRVLTDSFVRFSQKQVFDDELEFTPPIARYGTEEEIRTFMKTDPVLSRYPEKLMVLTAKHILSSPEREQAQIDQAKKYLTAPDEYVAFCLTEDPKCERMWIEYAANRSGFVVAFDTTHPKFSLLRRPGLLGKVEYTDDPISSFLSTYGTDTFFRKRTKYSFELEWRSLRSKKRFDHIIAHESGLDIYLAPFDPACIAELLIQKECSVGLKLRLLASVDFRYRHVPVKFVDE